MKNIEDMVESGINLMALHAPNGRIGPYKSIGKIIYIFEFKTNEMKKTFILAVCAALTSCYSRIGQLTIISTRNIESKADYILIQKEVEGKAKTKNSEALEIAIDNAVKKYPTGEFMKNVVVEVSKNGKKIKVTGDVWGYPVPATN